MKKLFPALPFVIIAASTYCTFSNSWIVSDINAWQAKLLDDNTFFPAQTIFVLALPTLLILLAIKLLLKSNPCRNN